MNTVSFRLLNTSPAFGGLFDRLFKKGKKTPADPNGPVANGTQQPVAKAEPAAKDGILNAVFERALTEKLETVKNDLVKRKVVPPKVLNAITGLGFQTDARELGVPVFSQTVGGATKPARIISSTFIPSGFYSEYKKPGRGSFHGEDPHQAPTEMDLMEVVVLPETLANSCGYTYPPRKAEDGPLKTVKARFCWDKYGALMGIDISGSTAIVRGIRKVGVPEAVYVIPDAKTFEPLTVMGLRDSKKLDTFGKKLLAWYQTNLDDPTKVGVFTWPAPVYEVNTFGEVKVLGKLQSPAK